MPTTYSLYAFVRLVDMSYTLRWDAATNLPYYLGFLHTTIRSTAASSIIPRYNEDAETWQLTSDDNSVNGSSVAAITSMGTGAQTWQFDRYLGPLAPGIVNLTQTPKLSGTSVTPTPWKPSLR